MTKVAPETKEKGKNIPEPKWVTEYVNQIIEKFGREEEINISTGISLSGPVHVGHLREFMTGAVICNSLRAKGYNARLLAFADDMDPLKRRYDFLPENYQQYVGVPLYMIPSNYEDGLSYSDYFLREFVEALHQLGIDPVIIKSSDMYNSGVYDETSKRFMRDRAQLQGILRAVSGTKKENIWPFKFVCPDCHSSTKTEVTDYNTESGDAAVHCDKCTHDSHTNISSNGGKLMWRFDWPARWDKFNIHAEPVAQDHASKGGSYDTSDAILSNYFGKQAPVPLKYAWVKNKASADLHTKTGVTSVRQLVEAYPAPVIWSMYALQEPRNPVLFDLKGSMKEETRKCVENQAVMANLMPEGIELSPVFQRLDIGTIIDFVRTGRPIEDISERDLKTIRTWIQATEAESTIEPQSGDEQFVVNLRIVLSEVEEWTPKRIKEAIIQYANQVGLPVKEAVLILYRTLFSAETGPNIAQYFGELPKEEVLEKLALD